MTTSTSGWVVVVVMVLCLNERHGTPKLGFRLSSDCATSNPTNQQNNNICHGAQNNSLKA